jgi:shikimate dehydrogenase
VTARRAAAAHTSLAALQALVENPIPDRLSGGVIVLIGDHPSAYSRSPQIWKAALAALGLEAGYIPLDIPADRLGRVIDVLRGMPACWGANVTVPYKEAVIPLLDEVDPAADAAGAVNTIVRRNDGRLTGSGTDGVGLIAALLDAEKPPLLEALYGLNVLLIGAGGAARSAAAAVAPLLGTGELIVSNRGHERAAEVAARAQACGARARAVAEAALDAELPSIGLVINASTRGQGGIRKSPVGWTCLEPYSALAPAEPPVLPPGPDTEFMTAWAAQARAGVEANHAASRARMRLLPPDAVVFDMIYAPEETVTVRHAGEAGLRADSGRWMMIVQAVEACVGHICARSVGGRARDREHARREVTRVMAAAWPG